MSYLPQELGSLQSVKKIKNKNKREKKEEGMQLFSNRSSQILAGYIFE